MVQSSEIMDIPSLRFHPGQIVTPGDRIGNANQISSGPGTYVKGLHVYASLAGTLRLTPHDYNNDKDKDSGNGSGSGSGSNMETIHSTTTTSTSTTKQATTSPPIASVILRNGQTCATNQMLSIGQIILGRIVRISTRQAIVEIIAATNVGPLKEPYGGVIRKEDIRLGATEEIDLASCFRPGDVILARILSLGDTRRYYLSTTENQLGVIRATCATSGRIMSPVSWKEMECPDTKKKELRKCARPPTAS